MRNAGQACETYSSKPVLEVEKWMIDQLKIHCLNTGQFATGLAKILFSEEERYRSCCTKTPFKDLLDPERLAYIRKLVFHEFDVPVEEYRSVWVRCMQAINSHCRYIRWKLKIKHVGYIDRFAENPVSQTSLSDSNVVVQASSSETSTSQSSHSEGTASKPGQAENNKLITSLGPSDSTIGCASSTSQSPPFHNICTAQPSTSKCGTFLPVNATVDCETTQLGSCERIWTLQSESAGGANRNQGLMS